MISGPNKLPGGQPRTDGRTDLLFHSLARALGLRLESIDFFILSSPVGLLSLSLASVHQLRTEIIITIMIKRREEVGTCCPGAASSWSLSRVPAVLSLTGDSSRARRPPLRFSLKPRARLSLLDISFSLPYSFTLSLSANSLSRARIYWPAV